MSRRISRFAATVTVLAAAAMTASPVMARGWGHRHHNRGVDAGDVIAGLLIFGTVAAVASAASKSDRQRRDTRDRDYRSDDYERDRRDSAPSYGEPRRNDWQGSRGIGSAIDVCADEVERGDRRIESVDAVNREGEGWIIRGRVGSGSQFDCSVSDSGRVRSVTVDGRAA